MVTIYLTIVPAKALKDGKQKVRIAVSHRSQTRHIVTDVVLNSAKEWKNGKVVKRGDASYLNQKLLARLNDVQHIVDEIPYTEGISCSELVETIQQTKTRKSHTLRSAFEEMQEVSTAKESTKTVYRCCFNFITSIIPEKTLVNHITPLMVNRLVKEGSRKVSPASLQCRVAFLSQIINYCQRNGYTEFITNPTEGLNKNVIAIRQNWLSPDEIRNIRDCEIQKKDFVKFRDIFMLSYYLGGINIIDIAKINFNECSDTLHYIRTKTERKAKANPFVEFSIPNEAKQIIDKYKGRNGHLGISISPEIRICKIFGEIVRRYRDTLNLPSLTFYSARKSFAQHAFMLGESESVIDYVLGHSLGGGKNKMLYSYVKVTPEMATACVRKVCDFIASSRNF